MAIIAQIKLECIKENKYYDDETDLLSSVLHAKKKMHEMLPACCHFASWQVTLIEKKKILGISTGNFSQNRKYIAVSKATNSFSAVCN